MKANENVRKAARMANVPLWMVAHAIEVSEPTLHRWLRFPLPAEKESTIMAAIERLSQEVG